MSRADYYYHKEHPINSYQEANIRLDAQILDIYDESDGIYESSKIIAILRKQGILVSQKRVARRMKKLEIRSVVTKEI